MRRDVGLGEEEGGSIYRRNWGLFTHQSREEYWGGIRKLIHFTSFSFFSSSLLLLIFFLYLLRNLYFVPNISIISFLHFYFNNDVTPVFLTIKCPLGLYVIFVYMSHVWSLWIYLSIQLFYFFSIRYLFIWFRYFICKILI